MLPTLNTPVMGYFGGTQEILISIFIVTSLISSIFWIVELVDVARRQFPDSNLKIVWILVLVFAHGIGAIVYYIVGKKQGYLPGEGPNRY